MKGFAVGFSNCGRGRGCRQRFAIISQDDMYVTRGLVVGYRRVQTGGRGGRGWVEDLC